MVRFSCFIAQVHNNKPNKTGQPSIKDGSQKQASTDTSISSSLNALCLKAQDMEINNSKNHSSNLALVEHGWKLEVLNRKTVLESEYDTEDSSTTFLKKSQSLESGLYQEGRLHADNFTEVKFNTNTRFSCNGSKSQDESTMPDCREDQEANPTDGSIFLIGDPSPTPSPEDAHEYLDTPSSGEYVGDSADLILGPGTLTPMVRTDSLPNIRSSTLSFVKCSFKHAASRSKSSGDLNVLGMISKDTFINKSDDQLRGEQGRENNLGKTEGSHIDSSIDDCYDSYLPSSSTKDWDTNSVKTLQGESSNPCWDELPNEDFKAKRIEDWVIALQHCGPLEEIHESSESISSLNGNFNTINVVIADRMDFKVIPGMEATNRYVSSLSAHATTAQMANHGLVVIPFLSSYSSLKELNLSGNAIVRITTGALPQGLRVLNLSKNNISTIEGLRELTRLRVLDLSYNHIHKIGHGLASCSTMKELYLAGNKISEVEGLHRLLKLSVLDFSFNKISTTKSLGQLAANYNSLQAINLEGNPAQRNVGDEQLKKNLHDLLPHLTYYNEKHIKAGTLKDTPDRSVRFGSHQCRSDHKITVKGRHGVATRRPSSSSAHARRSQTMVLPNLSKSKHDHSKPVGTKLSTHESYSSDVNSKLLNFRKDAIRRTCSEGTLGAL